MPPTWSFGRLRERRTDHDCVGTTGECFAYVAASPHAAVGDDRYVAAGSGVEGVTRSGAIHGRGHLGYANAEHLTTGARRARSHANEQTGDPRLHQLKRRAEADAVANHDRHTHAGAESRKVERGCAVVRAKPPRRDSRLDDE